MEEINREKIQKVGNAIADVLKENDAFDAEGLAALTTSAFSFLKTVTVADENGKKKERMRMILNQMLDDFFEEQGGE